MLPQVNLVRAKHGDFLAFFESAGISGVLSSHGVWDEATVAIAKALLDIQEHIGVVLDVGANMGTFTVPIAKHIIPRGGIVKSFEPQRIVYYQLCGNIFLNRLSNAFAHNIALSAQTKIDQIEILNFHTAWNIGAFSLLAGHDTQKKEKDMQMCSLFRLDDFENNALISLIKIDVEGMEVDVIEGGLQTIRSNHFPPILFECLPDNSRAERLHGILEALGYQSVQYAEADWLAQHPDFPREIKFGFDENHRLTSVVRQR
jgi:FkbM family methyltransferase